MEEAHLHLATEEKLISIGKIIISNACIFAYSVEKWNALLSESKTWSTFKINFTRAQSNYKNARRTDTTGSHGYSTSHQDKYYQENVVEYFIQALEKRQETKDADRIKTEANCILAYHYSATSNVLQQPDPTNLTSLLQEIQ